MWTLEGATVTDIPVILLVNLRLFSTSRAHRGKAARRSRGGQWSSPQDACSLTLQAQTRPPTATAPMTAHCLEYTPDVVWRTTLSFTHTQKQKKQTTATGCLQTLHSCEKNTGRVGSQTEALNLSLFFSFNRQQVLTVISCPDRFSHAGIFLCLPVTPALSHKQTHVCLLICRKILSVTALLTDLEKLCSTGYKNLNVCKTSPLTTRPFFFFPHLTGWAARWCGAPPGPASEHFH